MQIPTKLELAKDFVEMSILINPQKQFILPDRDKIKPNQKILYSALLELKRSGLIRFDLSERGEIIARFCKQ